MPARHLLAVFCTMLVGLVFQTALINKFIHGVSPDIIIAIVTAVGLIQGPIAGAVAGLVGGMLGDLLFGRLIGLGALSVSAAGLCGGLIGRGLFRENWVVPFIAGAIVAALYQVIYVLGANAFGANIPFGQSLARVLLLTLCYNGVLTGVMYPAIHKAYKWLN